LLIWVIILNPFVGQVWAVKTGGTLRLGLMSDPEGLDPHKFSSVTDYIIGIGNVYNMLVTLNDRLEVIPDLAKAWKVGEDGKIWDFYLREGVKFHDGSELTADVVKWNYERAVDPKTGWRDGRYISSIVEKVEAPEKYTFRFTLKQPYPNFIVEPLARVRFMIVSKEAVQKWGDQFGRHPVGTGPFKLTEWIPGDRITLERNEAYFRKGIPYLGKIIIKPIPDVNVKISALRAGEIDLIKDIPGELVALVKRVPKVKYVVAPPDNQTFLFFNIRPEFKTPFLDKRVRQAIGFGIDRKEITDLVYFGLAFPNANFIPESHPFYYDTKFFKYDPEKARALLKEAGATNLSFEIVTNNDSPAFYKVAQVIKEQLGKIGVRVEIKMIEKGASMKAVVAGNYQAHLEDLNGQVFPSQLIGFFLISGTPTSKLIGYSNPAFDKLMAKAEMVIDPKEQKRIFDQAQDIGIQDAAILILNHSSDNYAMRDYVKGFVKPPFSLIYMDLQGIWLDK
jgi:peptide/nickel transport system substrate-binding protein